MKRLDSVKQYINKYLADFKAYNKGAPWCYEDGIILTGCEYLYDVTKEPIYYNFILKYLEQSIDENGQPNLYKVEDYNVDNINAGKILFNVYQQTKNPTYKKTLDLLFSQLKTHPRTKSQSFWHKKRYPNQIWLDGLYMAQPFYARYIKEYTDINNFEDCINQFKNARKYLWDDTRKLYVHAYDETKEMQWADKETGRSPNVWSRAAGWFAMALVDIMEICDSDVVESALKPMLIEQIDGMLRYQNENGMWNLIVDKLNVEGNYHETSGTLMIAYAILKGIRLGYLEEKYLDIGLKAFEGTVEKYLIEENGVLHLDGTCEVAGLDNKKRDGSIEYYLSENIARDEAKGVAPLIMAYSEVLRLEAN